MPAYVNSDIDMKKPQIVITFIAVVAIGVLLILPKVVVDNEGRDNNLESRQSETEITSNAMAGAGDDAAEGISSAEANPHTVEMPADIRKKINSLRENFENSQNSEKSINFAAELVQTYKSVEFFDSAAWFADKIASKTGSIKDKKNAGELYYEAFSHALDAGRAQFFGDKARNYLEQVLHQQPDDLEVKNKLAMTYVSTSNPMQGIKMLREVLNEDENNETAIFNLGLLSIQSGQHSKAAERFEKLITINPDNLQAHYWLGVSYFELGKKKKAKAQFEAVKKMDGDPEIQTSADNYLERI